MQISTNAMLETHATVENVKILMDLTTASVHLVMSLIQVGNIVWVSSCVHSLHLASSFIFFNGLLDLDECLLGLHNCDRNAFCVNKDGGFECTCKEDYFGNGTSCFCKIVDPFILLISMYNITITKQIRKSVKKDVAKDVLNQPIRLSVAVNMGIVSYQI